MQCQKWCLPASDQLDEKKGKEREKMKRYFLHQPFGLWRKFQQIPSPRTHTLTLVNVSASHMTQVLFKLLPLIGPRGRESLVSRAFGSPRCKPHFFAFCLSPGLQLRPLSLQQGTPTTVVFLSLLGYPTRSKG